MTPTTSKRMRKPSPTTVEWIMNAFQRIHETPEGIKIEAECFDEQLVFVCPYCAQSHRHGGGYGHRVAHCLTNTPLSQKGYHLIPVGDLA